MAFMKEGCLPTSNDSAEMMRNQKSMRDDYHVKFGGDLNPDGGQGLARLLRSDQSLHPGAEESLRVNCLD